MYRWVDLKTGWVLVYNWVFVLFGNYLLVWDSPGCLAKKSNGIGVEGTLLFSKNWIIVNISKKSLVKIFQTYLGAAVGESVSSFGISVVYESSSRVINYKIILHKI